MLIKEEDGRLNFIDLNDNFVGFLYKSTCCEKFGYCITDIDTDFSTHYNYNIDISDDNWVFDIFCDPIRVYPDDPYSAGGGVKFLVVNEVTDEKAYIVIYNYHNGFYYHGWDTSFGAYGVL